MLANDLPPPPSSPGFADTVARAIATLSADGPPRIETVARALGTGVRTLQRRLAKTGTSYERLLASARLGVAIRLLASTDASVLEIALDVGYSDHAHFTRAFRKWTGLAPRQFRKSRRATGASAHDGRERRAVAAHRWSSATWLR